jgi:hypothetical protein
MKIVTAQHLSNGKHLALRAIVYGFCILFLSTPLISSAVTSAERQKTTAMASSTATSTSANPGTEANRTIEEFLGSKDLTKPEIDKDKEVIFELLEKRPVSSPGIFSFGAWWVQHSIRLGIPSNTIVLVLLLPILATMVAFVRVIVGLPSLEMLVPIALAYVLVAVGITIGGIILITVVVAASISRIVLRRLSIMHYPKRSLSMLLLSLLVFGALTASIQFGLGNVQDLSIFPILILTLLGDSIVSLQMRKGMREATIIIAVTIGIGVFGFLLATLDGVRNFLILYPEIVLVTIPLNILMGRYFGLRLSEVFRFRNFNSYGSE